MLVYPSIIKIVIFINSFSFNLLSSLYHVAKLLSIVF
ncbi:hypothetical protein CoNPh13_CDS0210 [Staphylococcus phage S-CoN_Ph13]|nr:hypothetical protein CoNPh13_CDS0210 [Staphylococcus phage S-CoN_Ph13]